MSRVGIGEEQIRDSIFQDQRLIILYFIKRKMSSEDCQIVLKIFLTTILRTPFFFFFKPARFLKEEVSGAGSVDPSASRTQSLEPLSTLLVSYLRSAKFAEAAQ